MADLVERVRSEMNGRIAELRPAVEELARLEAALAALEQGGGATGSSSAPNGTRESASPRRRGRPKGSGRARKPSAASAPSKSAATSVRRPGRRKGSGARSAQALEIVQSQPGIAIPEIAARMDIKQNYLYRVLPSLEAEGKVEKRGRGWHAKG